MNQIRHNHAADVPGEVIGFAELPEKVTPLEQPLKIGQGIMRNVVVSPMSALNNIQGSYSSSSLHHK